jgi:hypothetical protein
MTKRAARIEETESGLAVVREETPDSVVANKIVAYLKDHPHEHTVPEIAEATEAHPAQVTRVLDSYTLTKGRPKFVGEGCGGGWLPEEIAEQYRSTMAEIEDEG